MGFQLRYELCSLIPASRLTAAEKNLAVHVTHDGVRIVLVDSLQLASRLQNKASGDLTAADGGYQFFKVWNLPDAGALVDKAPHMDGQLSAVCQIEIKKIKMLFINLHKN